mgnify:CR=1 FL=1
MSLVFDWWSPSLSRWRAASHKTIEDGKKNSIPLRMIWLSMRKIIQGMKVVFIGMMLNTQDYYLFRAGWLANISSAWFLMTILKAGLNTVAWMQVRRQSVLKGMITQFMFTMRKPFLSQKMGWIFQVVLIRKHLTENAILANLSLGLTTFPLICWRKAKKIWKLLNGVMANLSNWYESKSLLVQALVDLICQRTSFVLKEAEIDRFLLMLADYGIKSENEFADSFFGEYEGNEDDVLQQFVQDWCALAKGCLPKQLLKQNNSAKLWHELIQFDFHRFVFKGNTYFFKRNF